MNWPQILILVLTIVGLVFTTVKIAKGRQSSGVVTAAIFLYWAWVAFYNWVLYMGGFWR